MEKGLIFTYVVAYGGAVVSLRRPFVGLLCYVCFSIVKPESMWYWSVPQGNYSRILALAMLAGWLIQREGDWALGRGWGPTIGLLLFTAWAAFTAFVAPMPEQALPIIDTMAKMVIPFIVGASMLNSKARLRQFVFVMTVSMIYVAYEMNKSYYDGPNRLSRGGFGGLDNNTLGVCIVTFFGMAFFMGMYADKLWERVFGFVGAAMIAHCAMFSFSRGSLFALIATAAASIVLAPKRPVHYLYIALALALAIRLAGAEVQNRFMSSFKPKEELDSSAQSRYKLWEDCWHCTLDNPILGAGPNHWYFISHQYGWPFGKQSHTTWLHVSAEMGFPGLFFFGGLYYGQILVRCALIMRLRKRLRDPWLSTTASMVVSSLLGFAVGAQFVTLVTLEPPMYIALAGVGALRLYSQSEKEGTLWKEDDYQSAPLLGKEAASTEPSPAPALTVPGALAPA